MTSGDSASSVTVTPSSAEAAAAAAAAAAATAALYSASTAAFNGYHPPHHATPINGPTMMQQAYPNHHPAAAPLHHHHPYAPPHGAPPPPATPPAPPPATGGHRRASSDSNGRGGSSSAQKRKRAANGYDSSGHMSETEFQKRAKAMTEGDDEPLTDNEKHALRNSSVTEDGRHVCGACGRTLVSQWGLDAHIKTVHGRKTFKCEFCHKAFGRRDHLVNHTNSIHTGSKECSQCGTMCKGKDGLMKHVKEMHPASPPQFPCNVCGKKFPTEDNCRIHYQQIHGEVKCSECHMVCVGTEGLKGHVKSFHQAGGGNAAPPAPPTIHPQLHPQALGNGYHHPTLPHHQVCRKDSPSDRTELLLRKFLRTYSATWMFCIVSCA